MRAARPPRKMSSCTISPCGVYFLVCCFATLFAASRPMAYAACVNGHQEGCDDGENGGLHHVMRRSVPNSGYTLSTSLNVVFIPVVENVTYYNTGDEITFSLNLTHNQSASADLKLNLKVVLSSQFLTPVANSLLAQAGSISGETYNATAISFDIASLAQADVVSVTFKATVTDSIHPLANLYFTVLVWGQDDSSTDYYYGPVPSQPTQYVVFPTVLLSRNSQSYLWVGNTTGYTMTITMPKLDFSLVVEVTTHINDFSFMELHNVQLKGVGSNIKSGSVTPAPVASYDSSEEVPFNDRAVFDFGNLTVSGNDESNRKIVIQFNVTIRDHPQLANDSKHWVGAGMRSGYQMLWVGQEALYVYKSEPSLTANFTTLNNTATKRYLIGDQLYVDWVVQHTYNTSYETAENVRITFYSSTLKILQGTYDHPGSSGIPLTMNGDFRTSVISVATLAQGQQISGSLILEVSNNISPLENLDVFLELKYTNIRGDEKLNTTHKPSPPYVAGVPTFSLKHNASTNQIRIGGRATFVFDILMRKLVSTLKVEVILPVNETSIMSLISFEVISVGKNINNNAALSQIKAELSSTVNDPKLYDRGTIDFGTVENTVGNTDHPDNKITLVFEVIVNDHTNVTNGSKHWVGVGVYGGKRMMYISDAALIADVPVDRRPVLQVSVTCALPGTKLPCAEATSLTRSSKIYFNGTVYHDERSQQYADKVNLFMMIPPYVQYRKLDHDSSLTYQKTQQGPKFSFNQELLHFLDRLTFSVEGDLDPEGLMPPGETYAVSPLELSYSPYSISVVFRAPLVPVSVTFQSPVAIRELKAMKSPFEVVMSVKRSEGLSFFRIRTQNGRLFLEFSSILESYGGGAPAETPSELSEVYSRGFLLDTTNNILYICQKSNDRVKSSCFSTSDEAATWIAMDQQVCYVIGQDGNDLYGIACNNRAYMRKRGPQGAWYGIEKEAWLTAKAKNSNIKSNLVEIEENYSHTQDPEAAKTRGSGTQWGANSKGVYIKSGGPWKMKAQWKCCGN